MTRIVVRYHEEPEGVWADSEEVPGFVAAGSSLVEVRELVAEGLPFYLKGQDYELVECSALDSRFLEPTGTMSSGSTYRRGLGSYPVRVLVAANG